MQHERRFEHAKSAPAVQGGEVKQTRANLREGAGRNTDGRVCTPPLRIKPLRLKSGAVASKTLVLNRALFSSAERVRAARLGVPVFELIELNSVQPKVRIVLGPELSGLRGKHVRGAASWLSV